MRLFGEVQKGWGSESILVSNDLYCAKYLNFKKDAKFSMHFHSKKDETWVVLSGKFKVVYINTNDASRHEMILEKGSTWRNVPLVPHQLICIEEGSILEVSTPDSVEDNFRVEPGDSQR